jgi:hypothetical protein
MKPKSLRHPLTPSLLRAEPLCARSVFGLTIGGVASSALSWDRVFVKSGPPSVSLKVTPAPGVNVATYAQVGSGWS